MRYEQKARTVFLVSKDEDGEDYGEVVFGPDIYPGESVIDPNSALSLQAAAAHELTHFHRWKTYIFQMAVRHSYRPLKTFARYFAQIVFFGHLIHGVAHPGIEGFASV